MVTAKSYFSGAGGMDLGLIEAGIDITDSYEIDSTCCDTLRKNFNHRIHEEDITKLTVKNQPQADMYIATFPCTHYSNIADIHGTRTGDDLFLHFFRTVVLGEPEMFLIENVPGMRKFKVVMEAFTEIPDYYVRVECPVNANLWGPQERERLLLFATKKPFDDIEYPEKSKSIKLKDLLEDDPEVNIPRYVYNRLNGDYRDKPIISDSRLDDKVPCCIAHYSKDVSTRLVIDKKGKVRPYSVREYARLQNFPDWFEFCGSNSEKYKQIGNAVDVRMAKWAGEQALKYFNKYN